MLKSGNVQIEMF